ncbi:kinetochore-associated Ndc80 complex subunit spc25 [Podila horticola]|nr:kinetochore-associated Ndc80 complex subunit spc25 [Podila horticola]
MQPTMPPLPVPEFDSEELTARMQIFTNELNSCIQRIKSRIADGTEQWVQETSELQAMDRSLREELKVAQVQEQAVVKALKKEKEEAGVISKEVQQLTDTHDEVSETKRALMAQVNQLRKEVKAKREAKIAEKKALDEQVLKNRPELATFESVLAMRIIGVKVSDCSPNLPDLETHLQYLNDTRDFYGFLKRIRKAFVELTRK